MSGAFDQIRKKQLLESPETVNSDWASPSISLDDRVGSFTFSLKYENGSNVNMKVIFQVSEDDLNFGDVVSTDPNASYEVTITDNDGVVIFDIADSGASFGRVRVQVISGSIDVLEVKFNGTQFH